MISMILNPLSENKNIIEFIMHEVTNILSCDDLQVHLYTHYLYENLFLFLLKIFIYIVIDSIC